MYPRAQGDNVKKIPYESPVLDELLRNATEMWEKLPPEDREKRRRDQLLSFAYGNLACSSNHKPQRAAFQTVALARGFTEAEFDAWADVRHWWNAAGAQVTFQCCMCRTFFESEWTDEEARAEAEGKGIDPDESGVVCTDCYQKTPWGNPT
jgi:hypothetical protein